MQGVRLTKYDILMTILVIQQTSLLLLSQLQKFRTIFVPVSISASAIFIKELYKSCFRTEQFCFKCENKLRN